MMDLMCSIKKKRGQRMFLFSSGSLSIATPPGWSENSIEPLGQQEWEQDNGKWGRKEKRVSEKKARTRYQQRFTQLRQTEVKGRSPAQLALAAVFHSGSRVCPCREQKKKKSSSLLPSPHLSSSAGAPFQREAGSRDPWNAATVTTRMATLACQHPRRWSTRPPQCCFG